MARSQFGMLLWCVSLVQLSAAQNTETEQKKEQSHLGLKADVEWAQNREAWDSISQNAYFDFRLLPYYQFETKWLVATGLRARQQIQPESLWRWADTYLLGSSPQWKLSEDFEFSFNSLAWFSTSKFSRRDLERYLALELIPELSWICSPRTTWALNKLAYKVSVRRNLHKYSTDVTGDAVTDWILMQGLDAYFVLWKSFQFEPSFLFESEFRSSGTILNSFALEGLVRYQWNRNLSTYVRVINSGNSYRTQERFGRFGNSDSRDTEFRLGVGLTL